ncbi:carboxymethylenebutenolidase [Tamaricihabitans halophyticus]|uniref:Carboxymethylenebutenolidase n=1 Tax=Tamaricihabitans halophyticus TaxID=1262583 RepID=A0A4R2R4J6_9PSEU|nr:dienelactone hydrolase family protein [Tamaricihabitans halophyticus]TCP54295.1 carboxymethylenebutenolidase [Tamaricihabitans halophyticus]
MPHARIETISLPDGNDLPVSYAEPDGAVRGGLVVLAEPEGAGQAADWLVAALASEGWLAVAPDVYRGQGGADALAGVELAVDWLAAWGVKRDLTGVLGFDLGGALALVTAARVPVGAAVSVAAGGISEPPAAGLPALATVAGRLTCPWLGLYGDRDASIAVSEIERLRGAADTAKVATDVVRFPAADHRFDTDPDAAHEAWLRTRNWFDSHLR